MCEEEEDDDIIIKLKLLRSISMLLPADSAEKQAVDELISDNIVE
jgi:hypothetical protein